MEVRNIERRNTVGATTTFMKRRSGILREGIHAAGAIATFMK